MSAPDGARKGIILAGGSGTRLWPSTHSLSKQLIPVYDKPMIFYPLTTLILSGIRDIIVITSGRDTEQFKELLGDGSRFGVNLSYAVQERPDGIAQALLLAKPFIAGSPSALILGDNLFFASGLANQLQAASARADGATIFAYRVHNPQDYGVVEFGSDGRALSIEEKPREPKSPYAVVGLYFYDENACDYAAELRHSARGELEITDLNRRYLEAGTLNVQVLGRGTAWLDTGTHDALLAASNFVAIVEQRQGLKIGSPEEAAFRMGWLTPEDLRSGAVAQRSSAYGKYLAALADEGTRSGPHRAEEDDPRSHARGAAR
ncbi:MAG TPA: glucose-1-phosphate thymidylyltransferase RfbA [Gemmatimonadaceae bacterium]|nr:glucose-1-phosphate thymidylyltransferase RfbA [Gemmatimonadaceae bacterium]